MPEWLALEWLALCDLGAPGGGEPWFPHSAVLLFLTSLSMASFVLCLCFSVASLVAISITWMMRRHYRCILAVFHV